MKRILQTVFSAALLPSLSFSAKQIMLEVDEFAEEKMNEEGLALIPHTVETNDGYFNVILQIVSTRKTNEQRERKSSVLLHHGSSMDGLSWFDTEHESLPSLLTKQGFNVFLSNDRGTKNSRRHGSLHAVEEAKKFFDFSFQEIGEYDVPANLNFVRDHSDGRGVIYIGYASGATAMLYGLSLADERPIFQQLVQDVVLLAPCVFLEEPIERFPGMDSPVSIAQQLYLSYERVHDMYDQVGVYAYNGPQSEVDANKICHIFGNNHPECRRAHNPAGFGQTMSVKMTKHLSQNKIEGRFQEYSDTYSHISEKQKHKIKRQTKEIDLTDAQDAVPVNIFTGSADKLCLNNPRMLAQKFKDLPLGLTYEGWTHEDFVKGEHLDKLVADIDLLTMRRRNRETEQRMSQLFGTEL